MKPNKSQAALEFLVLAGVMMTVFVFFFAVATEKIAEMNNDRRDKIANDLMDAVVSELELAQQSLDGYSREFTLPNNVEGREYTMRLHIYDGENILTVMYMDKTYDRKVNVELEGTSNSIYMGVNKVSKTNGKIRVFNGADPCITLINDITTAIGHPPENSYCMGGICYCYYRFYAPGYENIGGTPTRICTNENDFDLAANECKYGCKDYDACNPAPAITPFNAGTGIAKVDVEDGAPPDMTAKLIFDTNESATAVVKYGQAIGGVCGANFDKKIIVDSLAQHFEILLKDMHADSEYCFRIDIKDSKGAERFYANEELYLNRVQTSPDQSPPLVREVYLYPVIFTTLPAYSYGQPVEIITNITDDTGVDEAATKIRIQQEQDDGSYIWLPDMGIQDTAGCGPSGRTVDGDSIETVSGDNGYITCFSIDNAFARFASYKDDADTLFYASYDTSAEAEKGGIPSQSAGTEIIAGRYGNGIYVSDEDSLIYPAVSGTIDEDEGTVEFWMKRQDSEQAQKTFFDLGHESINDIEIKTYGGTIVYEMKDNAGSPHSLNFLMGIDTEWHFIAATWKDLNTDYGEMYLYVDGEEADYRTGETIILEDIVSGMGIGTDIDESHPSGSVIDQFRILNKAESGDDIVKDYETERKYLISIYAADEKSPPYSKTYEPSHYPGPDSFRVNYGSEDIMGP